MVTSGGSAGRGGSGFTAILSRLEGRENDDRGGTTTSLKVDRTLLDRCRGKVHRYKLSFIVGYDRCCNIAASCLLNISGDECKVSRSCFSGLSNSSSSNISLGALSRDAGVLVSLTASSTASGAVTGCLRTCCVLYVCENTLAVTGTNLLSDSVFELSCGLNRRLTDTTVTILSSHFTFVRSGSHFNTSDTSVSRGTLTGVVDRTRRCVVGTFVAR